MKVNTDGFVAAKPFWLKDRESEMNVQAGFRCRLKVSGKSAYVLRITGSTLYRIFINGLFVHYGPARGPHGYLRIDEIDLGPSLSHGENIIAIEMAGYNCNSYYTLNIPSFLQAEILEDGKVIHSTGSGNSFSAVELTTRLKKAMRYSLQRTFTEVYYLNNKEALTNWIMDMDLEEEMPAEVNINKKYLSREVPVPKFNVTHARSIVEVGIVKKAEHPENFEYRKRNFINEISDIMSGYPLDEIEERPFEVIQDCVFEGRQNISNVEAKFPQIMNSNEYIVFDMGLNNNGFILSEITALEDSEVYFIFDEKLIDGEISVKSWSQVNIVKYSLKESEIPYKLESFETYGFRYIQCILLKGSISLNSLGLREYSYPNYKNAEFKCSDEDINAIFSAAVETYRQNTLDVFMDCPTRERAGWLCDSYFTSQSAQYFSGESIVERVMLENFVLADEFPYLPKGILPMCYPGDHPSGNFIPQWAMWYFVELDGYFKRSGREDRDKFKDLCYGLLGYLRGFKNRDGLLESLDKWNFIEWSQANEWVQDVHYPTNMLYSKVLSLAGTWFKDEGLLEEAESIKAEIIRQSFDGVCFVDNALRGADGRLEITSNKSEVCQYFAFFFDIADPSDERFFTLKDLVLNVFGPERKKENIMPEIAYANAFIGNYLRMEVLMKWRRDDQILQEIKGYFAKMAEITGTLWEFDSITGSLNHGFASFVGVVLIKCLFGLKEINMVEKTLKLDLNDSSNLIGTVRVGTPLGDIWAEREIKNGKPIVSYSIPKGFQCRIGNSESISINRKGEFR